MARPFVSCTDCMRIILILAIMLADLSPQLLFLDYAIMTGRAAIRVFVTDVAPIAGAELSGEIRGFANVILDHHYIRLSRAVLELLLFPWLLKECIASQLNWRVIVACVVDCPFFLLFRTRKSTHRCLWNAVISSMRSIAKLMENTHGRYISTVAHRLELFISPSSKDAHQSSP